MQILPYVVVSNKHIGEVYDLYYEAFESLRRIREIKTLDDNERLCEKISQTLQQHLPVIPKLSMGVLECRDLMQPQDMDKFMNTILRSVAPRLRRSLPAPSLTRRSASPAASLPSSTSP